MSDYKKPNWKPKDTPKGWNAPKDKEKTKVTKSSGPHTWESPQNTSASIDHRKEFLKKIRVLTYSRNMFDVWNDFVMLSSCSISNAFDTANLEKRENLYMRIIGKYGENSRFVFPELLAMTVDALDKNPDQDFLGSIFVELGLANKYKGQHFTPYDVAKAMAEITLGDVEGEFAKSGAITIHDPCCGSGTLLIASLNVARRKLENTGINFQNVVFISAQDIDQTVAVMCYIQLSLLGAAGYVKVGNALTEPVSIEDHLENYWFTPMYFSDVWRARRVIDMVKDLLKGESE